MLARLLLLISVISWGWSFVATKIALDYVTPAELLGIRLVLGIPIMAAVIAARRIKFRFSRKETVRLSLTIGVITVHFLIQVIGLKYTSATNTGWIIAIFPLVMAVTSAIFLRERIRRNDIAGIAVATVGIFLLISRGNVSDIGMASNVGDWLIIGSAFTWAAYSILTRDISRTHHPLAITFILITASSAIMLIYMAFTSDWGSFTRIPLRGVLALLFLGVAATALAHWFWQEGISRLGAAKAGMFLYLEPLATTALAVPMLGETFGVYAAIGSVCVLAGVWISQHRRRKSIGK